MRNEIYDKIKRYIENYKKGTATLNHAKELLHELINVAKSSSIYMSYDTKSMLYVTLSRYYSVRYYREELIDDMYMICNMILNDRVYAYMEFVSLFDNIIERMYSDKYWLK